MDEQMVKIWTEHLKEDHDKLEPFKLKLYSKNGVSVDNITVEEARDLARILMDLRSHIRCLHDEVNLEYTVEAQMKRLGKT